MPWGKKKMIFGLISSL